MLHTLPKELLIKIISSLEEDLRKKNLLLFQRIVRHTDFELTKCSLEKCNNFCLEYPDTIFYTNLELQEDFRKCECCSKVLCHEHIQNHLKEALGSIS